ncbi:alpha-D-ribose 1-methylphosphonate 5-triphosphate diphosphatase [Tropicimonas sp. IMCC34043]|uniref:alpha-D-ribose 1-methylphosphonate 5-triphosphate diphosphatase n=1 Tax=Tropicimonas sp. IMCC34043 TaxID=2248760 RepID=UPI000E23BA02|nr:alpha-D-ribose 1-methylphosphonate 5-triphosphate diphosphatase [Tropicimonas sp. IMCC34043]
MHKLLPPMRFTGAQILRDGELQRRSLAIADGRITKGPLPEVDMHGYLLLPGIIDLHSDTLERHIAPHSHADFDLRLALAAVDREAAANGVTTAWLAQGWSWEGGPRDPDFAERVLAAHALYRAQAGTDLRIQLRCQTHLIDTADRMLAAIRRHDVGYVVFNNHLERAIDRARDRPGEAEIDAARAGRSGAEQTALIAALKARDREVPRHLCRLADAFDILGVRYGSHDDPDGETRETYSMIGASIAEFPLSRRAAAAAKAMNDPVLLSAPNVVRDGSHAGNLRAADMIAQGLCDALVSDFYYPALAQAAWKLADSGLRDLPAAWAMISSKPAQILRLHDRGTLDFGRRADLVAVNVHTRAVEMTIAGGVLTYLAQGAACRFTRAPQILDIAAE